jgi:3-oxocholest-4-en-26-oate---CoA ligase
VDASIGTVWEAVAAHLPDAVAVSEPGRDHTYAEFDDRAARLASALEAAGVGPGDTVACYLYNSAAYLETVFAAFKIGAVPVRGRGGVQRNARRERHARRRARPHPAAAGTGRAR